MICLIFIYFCQQRHYWCIKVLIFVFILQVRFIKNVLFCFVCCHLVHFLVIGTKDPAFTTYSRRNLFWFNFFILLRNILFIICIGWLYHRMTLSLIGCFLLWRWSCEGLQYVKGLLPLLIWMYHVIFAPTIWTPLYHGELRSHGSPSSSDGGEGLLQQWQKGHKQGPQLILFKLYRESMGTESAGSMSLDSMRWVMAAHPAMQSECQESDQSVWRKLSRLEIVVYFSISQRKH